MGLGRYLSLAPDPLMNWMPGSRIVGVEVRFHYRFQALRPSRARAQGWVNVVRAWPVPDLGNTKAAFSLSGCMYVCWGGVLDAASPTSIQRPMAPEPDHPWHLGPSVDTQGSGVGCQVFIEQGAEG